MISSQRTPVSTKRGAVSSERTLISSKRVPVLSKRRPISSKRVSFPTKLSPIRSDWLTFSTKRALVLSKQASDLSEKTSFESSWASVGTKSPAPHLIPATDLFKRPGRRGRSPSPHPLPLGEGATLPAGRESQRNGRARVFEWSPKGRCRLRLRQRPNATAGLARSSGPPLPAGEGAMLPAGRGSQRTDRARVFERSPKGRCRLRLRQRPNATAGLARSSGSPLPAGEGGVREKMSCRPPGPCPPRPEKTARINRWRLRAPEDTRCSLAHWAGGVESEPSQPEVTYCRCQFWRFGLSG